MVEITSRKLGSRRQSLLPLTPCCFYRAANNYFVHAVDVVALQHHCNM